MEDQTKVFFVGLGIMASVGATLFLGYKEIIKQYENSLSCPEKTYSIAYNKKKNHFEQSLVNSCKISPKEARKKLASLDSVIRGDFDGNGIKDLAEIKERYDGSANLVLVNIPQYHKDLIINGKKMCEFHGESVGFGELKDVNSDGIKDIMVISIDHVYR